MKQAHFYMPAGEINPFGNGASKRSAQISALLLLHFQIENINILPGTFFSKFSRYYHALKFLLANPIKISTFRDFSILGYHYLNGKKNINNYKGNPQYLFWESTLNNYHYKPLLYKKMGCKLIAFPHNLESLVPGQISVVSEKPSPLWLDEDKQAEWEKLQHEEYYPADHKVTKLRRALKNIDDALFSLTRT